MWPSVQFSWVWDPCFFLLAIRNIDNVVILFALSLVKQRKQLRFIFIKNHSHFFQTFFDFERRCWRRSAASASFTLWVLPQTVCGDKFEQCVCVDGGSALKVWSIRHPLRWCSRTGLRAPCDSPTINNPAEKQNNNKYALLAVMH